LELFKEGVKRIVFWYTYGYPRSPHLLSPYFPSLFFVYLRDLRTPQGGIEVNVFVVRLRI